MKTDNRQKLLIAVAAAVAALFAGDMAVYTPLSKLWDKRTQEIRNLRAKIVEAKSLIKQEDHYHDRWNEMRTNALPDNQSIALEQVSKAFQTWAEESSVSLNGVVPQWKSDSETHKTVVCRVEASGSLWMLARFIYDIEKDPMGLKVESLDFSSRDNAGQVISLGLQVSGLVLNTQPE